MSITRRLTRLRLRVVKYAYRAVGRRAPWDYACPCCDQQQWDEFWDNAEVFYVGGGGEGEGQGDCPN